MKTQEAIELLEQQKNLICHDCAHPAMVGWCENHCKLSEAFDMAIEALKVQADSDTISRKAAMDALEKVAELFPWRVPGNRDSYDRYNEAWNDAIGRAEIEIEKLPSAQPNLQPTCNLASNDCISRKEAIDAVKHAWAKGLEPSQYIEELPPAQPEIIHCGDCRYKDDGIDEDGIPFLKCLHGRSYGGTRINDFCSWAERRTDG